MAITTSNMGLRVWDQLNDPYDHDQLANNWAKVDLHDHTPGRGIQIPTEGIADGAVTSDKISSSVSFVPDADSLTTSQFVSADRNKYFGSRGKFTPSVATEEVRDSAVSGTSYGLMPTPDQVPGIILPTDGLIFVAYQALWKESVARAARAAVFLNNGGGAVQMSVARNYASPGAQQAATPSTTSVTNVYTTLTSFELGLASTGPTSGANAPVITGQAVGSGTLADGGVPSEPHKPSYYIGGSQHDSSDNIVGGVCAIFAAAGTYDVSVQFKSSSGTVTRKNPKLWVWTEGF